MTLEELLQKHFGCKKPFLKKRIVRGWWADGEKEYEYFTVAGGKAYAKLITLIEDLGAVAESINSHQIISELDAVAESEWG